LEAYWTATDFEAAVSINTVITRKDYLPKDGDGINYDNANWKNFETIKQSVSYDEFVDYIDEFDKFPKPYDITFAPRLGKNYIRTLAEYIEAADGADINDIVIVKGKNREYDWNKIKYMTRIETLYTIKGSRIISIEQILEIIELKYYSETTLLNQDNYRLTQTRQVINMISFEW